MYVVLCMYCTVCLYLLIIHKTRHSNYTKAKLDSKPLSLFSQLCSGSSGHVITWKLTCILLSSLDFCLLSLTASSTANNTTTPYIQITQHDFSITSRMEMWKCTDCKGKINLVLNYKTIHKLVPTYSLLLSVAIYHQKYIYQVPYSIITALSYLLHTLVFICSYLLR